MRGFLILCATVLGAIAVGLAVEPYPSTANSWLVTTRSPALNVPPEGPCPSTIRGFYDVTNAEHSLEQHLLPQGALFGIICRYGSAKGQGRFELERTALVNGRTALAFEAAVERIATTKPRAVEFCPEQLPSATILAFGYGDGDDVDLWYSDSGCETLDNGFLEAAEVSNPAFSDRFVPLLNEIAPLHRSSASPSSRGRVDR